jgi:hypothetical protein
MPKPVTLAARVDADLDAELTRLATATGPHQIMAH